MLRIREAPSPNHDARPDGTPIDMLVLHYTGMRTAEEAILRLRDPEAAVSSHYVVEEDGTIWRLVPEERRAFHAGISHWRGREALNGRSIGIEIVNPGHEWGYRPFPALQMAAVCDLCLEILARHPIAARDVVAHSDIARIASRILANSSTGKGWRRTASASGRVACRARMQRCRRMALRGRCRCLAPSATARICRPPCCSPPSSATGGRSGWTAWPMPAPWRGSKPSRSSARAIDATHPRAHLQAAPGGRTAAGPAAGRGWRKVRAPQEDGAG